MAFVNVNGVWKNEVSKHVNVNGVWKTATTEYVNVNGVWRSYNPYPKFNPTVVTPAGSGGNITGYGANWVSDGYQLSLITGYDADQGTNRMYATEGTSYSVKINNGDVLEWTASYINYGNSGRDAQIYIGFFDRIPGSGWAPLPSIFNGVKSVPYSGSWVTTSHTKTYSGSTTSGILGLMVNLDYNYQHIVATIQSVKLNGLEILR